MQKKIKNLLALSIITISLIGSMTALVNIRSSSRITMDYIYFDIYKIDITDDFDGKGSGTITMTISFFYERMFGVYGERLYSSDGQYDDTGDSFQTFCSFDNDDTGQQTTNKQYDPSYCYRITNTGDEYKLKIKVTKPWRTSETETIYLGDSISYGYYYWSATIRFDDYDGTVKLYYKVVY